MGWALTAAVPGGEDPVDDTSRARRGLTWTVSSLVVLAVAQLAYTSTTARIIAPAQFGYYASAQALAAAAGYLSLASIGLAVMRHRSANGLRRAGVTFALTSGLLAGCLVALVGGPWARVWGIPDAADAARLAGLCVVLSPITAVMTGLQRRSLRYRHAALGEALGPLVGFGVGLVLALTWKSALALILGQAASSAVTVIVCVPRSRQAGDGQGSRVTWRTLVGFASNVSAQNFVYYVIYGLPPFAVSRGLGAHALGIYGRASTLITLPLVQLTQSVSKVLYPLWARRSKPAEIKDPFTDVLVGASLIGALGFGALFGAATPICRILLGPAFDGVDDVVRVLAVFGFLNLQLTISGSCRKSSDGCGTCGPSRLSSWV